MAKLFFLMLVWPGLAGAQIFGLPFGGDKEASAFDRTMEALSGLSTSDGGEFVEKFLSLGQEAQKQLDLMRAECQERQTEVAARQRCFREVVGRHRRFIEASHEARKRLLLELHKKQLSQLDDGKERALKEIERSF